MSKTWEDEVENPYPESIFPEPTKEEYALIRKLCQENKLTLDKFSGAMGRLAWNGCKKAMIDAGYSRTSPKMEPSEDEVYSDIAGFAGYLFDRLDPSERVKCSDQDIKVMRNVAKEICQRFGTGKMDEEKGK